MTAVAALLAFAITALPSVAPTDGDEACPARGAARLGRPISEMRRVAQAASESSEVRCARLGAELQRYLGSDGVDPCTPPLEPATEASGNEDPDLWAARAAVAWRCGDARTAHAAALRAVTLDPDATLAWTTLGRVLDARFRATAARRAFERALELDPEETGALAGLAKLTSDHELRIGYLRRLIAAGPGRGESAENLRHSRELIALIESLGDRPLWLVERLELPADLRLKPFVDQPGRISGWIVVSDLGDASRVPVLFDTGASGLHVAPHTARRAGVEPLASGTLVGGGGAGEHAVQRGVFSRFDLGPIAYRDALAQVAAAPLHARGAIQAIVGADLFDGLLLSVDRKKKRLGIREPPSAPAEDDPLQVDPWPADPDSLPILRVDGQLLVPLDLGPPDSTGPVLLVLDTGSAQTLLDVSVARVLPTFSASGNRRARLYGGFGLIEGNVGSLRGTLGSSTVTLRNVPVIDAGNRSRTSGIRIGGFLGLDALGPRPFEIDLSRGALRLGPVKKPKLPR